MKYFGGKNGKQLLLLLFLLLIFAIGTSIYFRFPIIEGAVGSSSGSKSKSESNSGMSAPSSITNIKDVLSLPGVGGNSLPSNASNNWSMVNEIVEPDGTIVQDIINTDGTVLTITNKQNVINTGKGSGSTTGGGNKGGTSGESSNVSTYNRNMF